MTTILGISAFYHDSAAAVVVDGEVVCAAQEERFTRKKHDHEFPKKAIDFCLRFAGLTSEQLDYVGFYDKPVTKFERLIETYVAFAPAGYRSFRQALPLWLKQKLPILELGDEVASTSGANVTALRRLALVAISLATAATVAVGGLLGWLALIVPHLARALSPRGVAQPWALSALLGAALMLAVDTLCRSVADVELPPGVVLAVLGVPGFLWVLLRGARA